MRYALFLLTPCLAFSLSYQTEFVGVKDAKLLHLLKDNSELVQFQARPPKSLHALQYRIRSDLPSLLEVLRSFSYYDASITPEIISTTEPAYVRLIIHPGFAYPLTSYHLLSQDGKTPLSLEKNTIPLKELGLKENTVATSLDIVNAEFKLLNYLAENAYPLAQIEKRKVLVDLQEKQIEAGVCVNLGAKARFGPSLIYGLKQTNPKWLLSKIAWEEGKPYNAKQVSATQERLLKTELFSSVYITHKDTLDEEGELPMQLRFTEAKYRSFGVGLFYATFDGVGGSFSWGHRNIRGRGESISAKGEFSSKFLLGNITYKRPDTFSPDQTYRLTGEISEKKQLAYHAFTYRGGQFLEKAFSEKNLLSYGIKVEHINVSKTEKAGTFLVLGLPLFANHNQTNDRFSPTKGYTLTYSITPYQSLFFLKQRFFKQRFTSTFFVPMPFFSSALALRAQLGSLAGGKTEHVPISKLFFGGSEENLRGYRHQTVSPLNKKREPLGGRAAIFTSAEWRIRFGESIGVVPFFDAGTVTKNTLPTPCAKWFKSLGIGLRYFAFFGPLRFDIGFPLDKRKEIDSNFQIYAAVGQTF